MGDGHPSMPGIGDDKSRNHAPAGGNKGRRTFAGQKMDGAAFSPKSGAGKYNWGSPMDDYYHGVDIEALDADEREEFLARRQAEMAEWKVAEKEYRRAEEAERAAQSAYWQAQKDKKAGLRKHATMNPYGMLEVQGIEPPPPLDFAFEYGAPPPHPGHPAMTPRQMRREDAAFNTAISEHRRIMHAEGLWNQPRAAAAPPHHPSFGPLHPTMSMSALQRSLDLKAHVNQMKIAQQAQQHKASHQDLSMQQDYKHYRGPDPRTQRQLFQPRGHARY